MFLKSLKQAISLTTLDWLWKTLHIFLFICAVYIIMMSILDDTIRSKFLFNMKAPRNMLKILPFNSPRDRKMIQSQTMPMKRNTFENKLVLFWFLPNGGDATQAIEYILETQTFHSSKKHIRQEGFKLYSSNCGACSFTYDRRLLNDSDAVVFHEFDINKKDLPPKELRRNDQRYIWWSQESGATIFASDANYLKNYFNYTMYVQRYSDIFAPYATFPWLLKLLWRKQNGVDWMKQMCLLKTGVVATKADVQATLGGLSNGKLSSKAFLYEKIPQNLDPQLQKLLKKKFRLVAWIVSKCEMTMGARLRFAFYRKLKKNGLKVDIFGECGKPFHIKSRWDPAFFEVLSRYKFYLAMPNSFHCDGYITEKVWYNALYSGAVPVIFGPHPDDVAAVLPPKTYIHAEAFSDRKALVNYLDYLDKNVTAYAEYLEWRTWTKYLDEFGNFRQIVSKNKQDKETGLSRDKIDVINKYAKHIPAGFCALCRKLYINDTNTVFNLKSLLLGNRQECFDDELASKITGLPAEWW